MTEGNNVGKRVLVRKEMRSAKKTFRDALKTDASESDLLALHDKQQKLKNRVENIRVEKMLKMRSILTPEQRKEAQGLFKNNRRQGDGQRSRNNKRGNSMRQAKKFRGNQAQQNMGQ